MLFLKVFQTVGSCFTELTVGTVSSISQSFQLLLSDHDFPVLVTLFKGFGKSCGRQQTDYQHKVSNAVIFLITIDPLPCTLNISYCYKRPSP